MRAPGLLDELGPSGIRAWEERVAQRFQDVVAERGENHRVVPSPTSDMDEVTAPDWSGFPIRVASCLDRGSALRLLDWRDATGDRGRCELQEEYLEWRVVSGDAGRIERVELTTEFADYWRVLAGWAPAVLLERVSEFAEQEISPADVFGDCDPFADGVTAEEREEAFATQMLPPNGSSPYNRGGRAICCMVQETNTLFALLKLAVAAAAPRLVEEPGTGRRRGMTAQEVVPLLDRAAQLGRSSDPVLVERLGRLAYEGRRIAFDNPLGIYIVGVEHPRLRRPDGSRVPRDWFHFSRGVGPEATADGRARYQRLVLEVPEEDLYVSDLYDAATEQPVRYGGQVAELVQLAVFLRITGVGAIPVEVKPIRRLRPPLAELPGCDAVSNMYSEFERSADGGQAG